jgi:hypothetical protein
MYLVHLTPVMYLIAPYIVNIFVKAFPSMHTHMHMVGYIAYWMLTLSLATVMHRLVAEPASKFLLNKHAKYRLQFT